jgi:competence ComEA-like helix-hairpin-helix protein
MIRSKVLAGALALAVVAGGASRLSVLRAAPQEAARPLAAPQINLNTATQAELEKLPGVGPSLASRILEYRTKNGGFKKIEEILENASSCPCLLRKCSSGPPATVSRNRRNIQQISQGLTGGGRSGGRTCFRRTPMRSSFRFGT